MGASAGSCSACAGSPRGPCRRPKADGSDAEEPGIRHEVDPPALPVGQRSLGRRGATWSTSAHGSLSLPSLPPIGQQKAEGAIDIDFPSKSFPLVGDFSRQVSHWSAQKNEDAIDPHGVLQRPRKPSMVHLPDHDKARTALWRSTASAHSEEDAYVSLPVTVSQTPSMIRRKSGDSVDSDEEIDSAPPMQRFMSCPAGGPRMRPSAVAGQGPAPHLVLSACPEEANICFVQSGMLESLQTPWPRCQELERHPDAFATPEAQDLVVAVSHAWNYQTHPDPLGEKAPVLNELVGEAVREIRPAGRTLAFVDFLSIAQRPFAAGQHQRSAAEERSFAAALRAMPSVYLYADAVLLLDLPDPSTVPGDGLIISVPCSLLDNAVLREVADVVQVVGWRPWRAAKSTRRPPSEEPQGDAAVQKRTDASSKGAAAAGRAAPKPPMSPECAPEETATPSSSSASRASPPGGAATSSEKAKAGGPKASAKRQAKAKAPPAGAASGSAPEAAHPAPSSAGSGSARREEPASPMRQTPRRKQVAGGKASAQQGSSPPLAGGAGAAASSAGQQAPRRKRVACKDSPPEEGARSSGGRAARRRPPEKSSQPCDSPESPASPAKRAAGRRSAAPAGSEELQPPPEEEKGQEKEEEEERPSGQADSPAPQSAPRGSPHEAAREVQEDPGATSSISRGPEAPAAPRQSAAQRAADAASPAAAAAPAAPAAERADDGGGLTACLLRRSSVSSVPDVPMMQALSRSEPLVVPSPQESVVAPFDMIVSLDGQPVKHGTHGISRLVAREHARPTDAGVLKAPFGKRNNVPAAQRGWIYLEYFIAMVKVAMADNSQGEAERIVFSNCRDLRDKIIQAGQVLRDAAQRGKASLHQALDHHLHILQSQQFTSASTDKLEGNAQPGAQGSPVALSDTQVVCAIMAELVEYLQEHWAEEERILRRRKLSRAIGRLRVISRFRSNMPVGGAMVPVDSLS